MSEDTEQHHHSLRERLDAAEAAADEVVSEETGEVNKLAVPFEELAAAVHAAIHPDEIAESEAADEVGDGGVPPPKNDTEDDAPAKR